MGPGKGRDIARKVATIPRVKMCHVCWESPDVIAVVGDHACGLQFFNYNRVLHAFCLK